MGLGQGQVGTVLSAERITRETAPVTSIKFNMGGVTATGDLFQDGGTDSPPLPGDFVALLPTQRAGGHAIVACADPLNTGVALPGEKRIYSRDNAGDKMAVIHLKQNGDIVIRPNGSGDPKIDLLRDTDTIIIKTADTTVTLDGDASIVTSGTANVTSGGDANVNGVVIKSNGDAVFPGSVIIGGKEMVAHSHVGSLTAPSGPQVNTGVVV